MGISGISFWQLLIVLLIALTLFGSGRIRSLGEDIGGAIGGFRKSLAGGEGAPSGEDRSLEKGEFGRGESV
ncbi:sec-independent protein translocase protein TatA [Microbulbifer donghaiensis]|uniref:Sec-independent protein translocase protein TatA n=1 Tax=Microbulbifer donghaiensis TaxID=494016 RepID=A0A1M5I2Z9_9GAMM|nr:twin-arginine translocase TatA/TatE family subunit [Microbulbifer donghaiensis]SHG22674.1 sec-independent protein translocase protein TatA [Microbulbifer donghaiensis]